jgi:hypothetical protein
MTDVLGSDFRVRAEGIFALAERVRDADIREKVRGTRTWRSGSNNTAATERPRTVAHTPCSGRQTKLQALT